MTEQSAILVTVILVTNRGLDQLMPAVRSLARQTIASSIELLVVAKRGSIDPMVIQRIEGFAGGRLVELETVTSRGEGAARAVYWARAPLIALHETHCFHEPEALQRLVEAHNGRTAAVAAVIRTANPDNLWGWATYTLTYAHCSPPALPNPRPFLPQHNAVYKRNLLEGFGENLVELMIDEDCLQRALIDKGYELHLVQDAGAWHINESRWQRCLTDPFAMGQRFGAARSRGWSWSRRLLYAASVPAIIAITVRRLVKDARRSPEIAGRLPILLPFLFTVGVAFALGEVSGYIRGSTAISERFEEHEFHILGRLAGVTPRSPRLRQLLAGLPADMP
jgi:hypothetical protein